MHEKRWKSLIWCDNGVTWRCGRLWVVGIYFLGNLSNIIDKEKIGLYRDDELSVVENANRPKLDRLRKDVIAIP